MVSVLYELKKKPHIQLIGPNCPGIIKPGECKVRSLVSVSGHMPLEDPGFVSVRGRGLTAVVRIDW